MALSACGDTPIDTSTPGGDRSILRLVNPTVGEVIFEGQDITRLTEREMRAKCLTLREVDPGHFVACHKCN